MPIKDKLVESMTILDFSDMKLPMVVVYDHPADYPDAYVARVWEMKGNLPTNTFIKMDTLEGIREDIQSAGFMEPGTYRKEDVPDMFRVNGENMAAILISQYANTVINRIPVSMPYQKPIEEIGYDEAATACRRKGNGWHLMTNTEWVYLMNEAVEIGHIIGGNTDNGENANNPEEKGWCYDGYTCMTGLDPLSWSHDGRKVFAIKGSNDSAAAYIQKPSKNNREKAHLFTIGVDTGKSWLMDRLKLETPGPGYCHFPLEARKGYDEKYFKGLTSEKKVLRYKMGRPYFAWELKDKGEHKRNEALDCRNYATAAIEITQLPLKKTEEKKTAAAGRKRKKGRRNGGIL